MAQINVTQQEVNFKPIKIEIILETQEDFDTIYELCNEPSDNISECINSNKFNNEIWNNISAKIFNKLGDYAKTPEGRDFNHKINLET
jgi:hypothetical protein